MTLNFSLLLSGQCYAYYDQTTEAWLSAFNQPKVLEHCPAALRLNFSTGKDQDGT